MTELKKILSWSQSEALLIKKHKKGIDIYNKRMTLGVVLIIAIILFLAVITGPFVSDTARLIICSAAFVIFLLLYCTCKKGMFDNSLSTAFYLSMGFGTALAIMLSIFASPNQRATILLGLFFIVPMAHIDYFARKLGFSIFIFISHTILAIQFKGATLAMVDGINSACFLCIGNFIGYIMQTTKLTSFELEKSLIFERETDILTGLKNRRKMIELFSAVEENRAPAPCCAVLLDIDYFKQYNDQYGHTVGDEYLRLFGETLLSFQDKYEIRFFRYGGEEFAAFMWGYSVEQQQEILESIRVAMAEMKIKYGRTVSIGYVDCLNHNYVNLEDALELADVALYKAKSAGRNQVVRYEATPTA